MSRLWLISTLFVAFGALAATSNPVPGGLVVLDLGVAENAPKVTFNTHQVLVTRAHIKAPWQAWVGIPLSQKLGTAHVKVDNQVLPFSVVGTDYPEQRLIVKKNQVWPSKEELERIRTESQKMTKVYRSFSPQTLPISMVWPVRGRQSSAFGLRRFFNDEERAAHSGIDIAASTGTPVLAPAAGKVVLTGHFFFNGKAVFIDHGQGLISMLCHLSAIDVNDGDEVKQGDLIGKVGATGRATGPHLHWTISLNNARIEPRLLLAADQPQQPN